MEFHLLDSLHWFQHLDGSGGCPTGGKDPAPSHQGDRAGGTGGGNQGQDGKLEERATNQEVQLGRVEGELAEHA